MTIHYLSRGVGLNRLRRERNMIDTELVSFESPALKARPTSRFEISIASSESEVLEAQRLRYMVFAEEMGAAIDDHGLRIDRDEFDPYCDHLIVRDRRSSEVIGTYRILSAEDARRAGGFYSEREFDLENLSYLRPHITEIGRACVHPAYRRGAVIVTLWSALARHLVSRQCRYVIGCGSIPLLDRGQGATSVSAQLRARHLSPAHWRVFPYRAFPIKLGQSSESAPIPPLIRGYLQLGAYVCGEPAWDEDFQTADVFMMLPLARMNGTHARHFFGRDADVPGV